MGHVKVLGCLGALCGAAGLLGAELDVDVVRTRTIGAVAAGLKDVALHYDFAERVGASGVVVDRSGQGRHGVCTDCRWSVVGCREDGSVAFLESTSRIDVPDAPDFTTWDAYTVGVWFLHLKDGDLGPQYGQKMLDRTSPGHDWHLSLRPSGHAGDGGAVGLFLHEGTRDLALSDATRDWGDGTWHHLVAVRSGAHGELWIDGRLRAETEGMFGVGGAGALCVGNSRSADRFQRKAWNGLLDEVQVFGRALSAAEIGSLYAGGVAGGAKECVTFDAPVEVQGTLLVSGRALFLNGIRLGRPQGELPMDVSGKGGVADAR